ncbi:radical SAM protein [candidate division KSB1 bacterium]|nr:cobalamin-dependent protein [candidate division KSB1 bacterium]RQW05201.1 MAG: radical SAM protein [candidate division KSB1 bacterium]
MGNVDILLAYPRERINTFYYMIPLGIAGIAALLEQHGFTVKIIDFNFYHGDFRMDVIKWNPKLIGIGGTTATRNGSFKTAKLAKQILPHVPVVYGGVHASFTSDDTLQHIAEIDYIVRGEGEFTFLKLAQYFVRHDEKIDIYNLPGLSYRNNKVVNNPVKRIDNLDDLPLPARHLFDGRYKIKLDYLGIEADFIMTSRGCPFSCTFCSASAMFPGGVRYRSPEHIQKEIDLIVSRSSIKALKIFDSTFTASKKHVLGFCELIQPYNLLWECEVRADTVNFALLQRMKEAGCCYIDVGLETTDEYILQRINKKLKLQHVERVLEWCRLLDIKTKVFFSFGHLYQSYQSCLNDVKYLKQHRHTIDFYATTVGLRVYPGTKLEAEVKKAGFLPQNFSWATFAPSRLNALVFEFDNVYVLNQPQLGFVKLFKIIIRLVENGTVGSFRYIVDLLWINLKKQFQMVGR